MTISTRQFSSLLALAVLYLFVPSRAIAYFEIELRDGGKVLADSYRVEGEKLLVFRGEIALELDRGAVKAIQDRNSDPAPVDSPAAVASAPATAPEPSARPSIENAAVPKDPTALENNLTRKLILSNRDLLFAENRGEDDESIRKRKEEIKKLQKDRETVRERLKR